MSPQAEASKAADLLRGYSIEAAAKGRRVAATCGDHLAPGTEVYIAWPPGHAPHALIDTAAALRAAGFVPVPHVAARNILSYTQMSEVAARLAGEAGVTCALVIGGDAPRPLGPYESSLELLRTGLLQRHGIGRIGLGCHPEAHHHVTTPDLDAALTAKLDLLRQEGVEAWLVSQFCFEAAPIVALARRLRERGITAPLRIGLAGPADRHTLMKFALHCGIGNSIRALGSRVDAIAQLVAREAPDQLVAELAAAVRREPSLGIEGVHLFTFGGIAASAEWANGLLRRGAR